MEGVVFLAFLCIVAFFFAIIMIKSFLLICHPNEVIILSGRRRKMNDGSVVGYRIIRGGRAFRMPLIERAAKMSLETIPLELIVSNAYSKGGIPLRVEAIANIKIDSSEPIFGNALERFLGKSLDAIHEIAKDTLEGNLRGVLAELTPEEVNEDRLKFAQSLINEADADLKQLGLHLDTLKIQNVSDEAGYLDSIGRRRTADVLTAARKAEAERAAEAEESEAEARRRAEVAKAVAQQQIQAAQIEAQREVRVQQAQRTAESEEAEAESLRRGEVAKAIAQQQIQAAQIETDREVKVRQAVALQEIETENNNLRVRKAELDKVAMIKEQDAKVSADRARVQFEQEVESARIILQQKRLSADVIEPARAQKEARELAAIGDAASVLEQGKAKLEVLQRTIQTYSNAGHDAERIYLMTMLPDIVKQLTDTVKNIHIDRVSVIDSGSGSNGDSIGRFVSQMPNAVVTLAETVRNATGINILDVFNRHVDNDSHHSDVEVESDS